jgi:hypothetical protein
MSQLQSSPDDANVINIDKKITATINVSDREGQLDNRQKGRLDKAVIRFSSWIILFQIIFAIPPSVVGLYYGINYGNQCPIQPLINVFLIVHGCCSLVNGIVLLIGFIAANYIKRSSSPSPYARCLLAVSLIGQLVLFLFLVAWLVVGQVWVFGALSNGFQSNDSTRLTTYCYSILFWNGFAVIIITYAVWLILTLVFVVRFIIKRRKIKHKTALTTDERSSENMAYVKDTNFNF